MATITTFCATYRASSEYAVSCMAPSQPRRLTRTLVAALVLALVFVAGLVSGCSDSCRGKCEPAHPTETTTAAP